MVRANILHHDEKHTQECQRVSSPELLFLSQLFQHLCTGSFYQRQA